MTRELHAIINGKIIPPQELGLRQASVLDILDIKGEERLFSNPFGNYSSKALDESISKDKSDKKPVSIDEAVQAIRVVQGKINKELRDEESEFIKTYCKLKGYNLSDVKEQIGELNSFVDELTKKPDKVLGKMLGIDPSKVNDYFSKESVIENFGLIASGNLGLFETGLLIYTGILARAAKNGENFSLTIKPSSEDFMFYDVINFVPKEFRKTFSRISWRSDVSWDKPLIKRLIRNLEGGVYFGSHKTISDFKKHIGKDQTNHFFYDDHDPFLIIGQESSEEELKESAKLAVALCYKSKGEACLSLQNVYVHDDIKEEFIKYLSREVKKINDSNILPMYPTSLLSYAESLIDDLRKEGADVTGKVDYDNNSIDIMLAKDTPLSSDLHETENPIPLLIVSYYKDNQSLIDSIKRESDQNKRHIYGVIIKGDEEIKNKLKDTSHRIISIEDKNDINDFKAYKVGTPHCSSLSFLANIFGIKQENKCYLE